MKKIIAIANQKGGVDEQQPLETAELQYTREREKLIQPDRKPLASPESFTEYVSDVQQKYEQLKASGACPYASLREYIESLLNDDIAEQFKSKNEKEDK